MHGDIVSTCTPTNTGPAGYFESTEYGQPRPTNTTTPRYGWLGGERRDTADTLAGLTLMGVRLYNPTSGRFLQTDPVAGGSCNAYDYTCANPTNATDLDGKRCWFWKRWCSRAGSAAADTQRAGRVGYFPARRTGGGGTGTSPVESPGYADG